LTFCSKGGRDPFSTTRGSDEFGQSSAAQ
jgi:hypothetical protein